MLLGRAEEFSRISALLDGALEGRSGALVARGDAGLGKSALLDVAASAAGFRVLRARGLEAESEIGYAGLHSLLIPIIDARSELPPLQSDVIAAALSLGPPRPDERLAIYAGTLGLLAAASRREPILAIIDDAHLLDRASAEAIGFVARRLRDDRVAMLLAVREGEPSALDTGGIPELMLQPLDDIAAEALLGRRRKPVTRTSRAHILALARGNPLAILELPTIAEGHAGVPTALDALSPGGVLTRVFGRRIGRLPRPTRMALAIAAASDGDDLRIVLSACRFLSIPSSAFVAAEEARIVEIASDSIKFRHPLVRAAVY
ncbi:MAG: AAA family ATPase, partial [Candidatus Limnocylindria bacterium]